MPTKVFNLSLNLVVIDFGRVLRELSLILLKLILKKFYIHLYWVLPALNVHVFGIEVARIERTSFCTGHSPH